MTPTQQQWAKNREEGYRLVILHGCKVAAFKLGVSVQTVRLRASRYLDHQRKAVKLMLGGA